MTALVVEPSLDSCPARLDPPHVALRSDAVMATRTVSKISPRTRSSRKDHRGPARTRTALENPWMSNPSDERRAASPCYEMPLARVQIPSPAQVARKSLDRNDFAKMLSRHCPLVAQTSTISARTSRLSAQERDSSRDVSGITSVMARVPRRAQSFTRSESKSF